MSGGMVPLPVPPVRAPSSNSCPPPPKPFTCHTFARSSEPSTLLNASETQLDPTCGFTKPFYFISFADPPTIKFRRIISLQKRRGEGCHVCHNSRSGTNAFAGHPLFFSITYGNLILQPFCFDGLSCNGGWAPSRPDLSFSSNFPNSAEDSYCQKLDSRQNRLCYTGTSNVSPQP